jgi:hypothetical protein
VLSFFWPVFLLRTPQKWMPCSALAMTTGQAALQHIIGTFDGVEPESVDLGHDSIARMPIYALQNNPLIAMNAEGSVVSGVADLMIQSSSELCIVDHKSARSTVLDTAFSTFVPQLLANSDVLTDYFGDQYSVIVGVSWTYHGKVWIFKPR